MATKHLLRIFTSTRNPLLQVNFALYKVHKFSVNSFALKPIFKKIYDYSDNTAVIDPSGIYTYGDIIRYSSKLQKVISSLTAGSSSKNVALMCPSDSSYVASLIGCWQNGNTVVPLCKDHPLPYLEYFLKDSQSTLVVVNKTLSKSIKPLAKQLGLPVVEVENPKREKSGSYMEDDSNKIDSMGNLHEQGAMIIYTSGTTGSPKGVVLTHGNFCAQVSSIVKAWNWSSNDTMLHALPLYHIHGILYALLCPLDIGACIVMLPKFDSVSVWEHLLDLPKKHKRTNLFFGVPTMYSKLLEVSEDVAKKKKISKEHFRKICTEQMRLMSCGSAALPEPVFLRWEELTGHRILERYGSTEIGMALSNPLNGPRIPGSVGIPLPGVSTCISKGETCEGDEDCFVCGDGEKVTCSQQYQGEPGNLLVKGANVFKEYWNKPDETKASFTSDGWFKTGDTASYENGYFRIHGRTSVDIIKSGGYKISALDIESVLLSHPHISECTVIGIPDDTWGEKVVAVVVTKTGNNVPSLELKTWCMERLPRYCVPGAFKFVAEIPRNHMGKVNKKEFKLTFSR